MRPAVSRIVELYKTSPVFQDLVETAAATTLAAGGQAMFTDMTPEQIAEKAKTVVETICSWDSFVSVIWKE